jgi:hypothetical protein
LDHGRAQVADWRKSTPVLSAHCHSVGSRTISWIKNQPSFDPASASPISTGTSELLLLYNEGSLENHFLELGSWDLWTLESYCSGALPIIQHRPVGGTKLAVVISLEPVSGNAGAPHHLSNSLEIPARN